MKSFLHETSKFKINPIAIILSSNKKEFFFKITLENEPKAPLIVDTQEHVEEETK